MRFIISPDNRYTCVAEVFGSFTTENDITLTRIQREHLPSSLQASLWVQYVLVADSKRLPVHPRLDVVLLFSSWTFAMPKFKKKILLDARKLLVFRHGTRRCTRVTHCLNTPKQQIFKLPACFLEDVNDKLRNRAWSTCACSASTHSRIINRLVSHEKTCSALAQQARQNLSTRRNFPTQPRPIARGVRARMVVTGLSFHPNHNSAPLSLSSNQSKCAVVLGFYYCSFCWMKCTWGQHNNSRNWAIFQ